MNICKFKGTPYYKAISDALVSGSIQVPSEDFTYKNITIEEYFSGDMISNGELLSKDNKASLLNSIQRDLEKENILTSEVKEKIEEIKTALDLSKETIVKSKVVKVPSVDVSKLSLFRISLSKSGRLLDISTTERGKLIPILNLELNNYVTSAILSSLKEVCLWNENKKLIIADNRELTESILTYRDSLIKVLNNFVGTNVSLPIGNNLSESDIEEYNNLLQSSWDAIKNILYRFNGEINVAYDENTANTLVNPIMAFYVLLNFDKVLSTFLSDFITINPGEYGNINSSDEKYKKKANKRLNSSYNDDINNSSGENLLDSILDTFITSTLKSDGTYLDKKFKENLLCVLRDAVENKRVRKSEVASEQKLIDSLLSILANEGNSADNKVNTLINLLGTTNSITEKLGTDSCKKLSQRLQDFLDAINSKKGISTSKQWSNIDNEYNVGYRLINHIANKGVVGITSITGATTTSSITPGTKEKSKQYVRGRLTAALADTLGSNRRLLTSETPLLLGRVSAEGITDLYSERAQDTLSKITGLNFRDESVIEKFSTEENLQKLANFLNTYRSIVQEMYPGLASSLVNDRSGAAEEIMKKIVISGAYIDFSDIFVEENEFELQRMFDQLGKEQARTTIATLSTQFTQCFLDFKDYMGSRPNRNILVRFPGISKQSEASFDLKGTLERTSDFAQYITFLGDCKFKNGDTVRWIKLRPNEVNTAYLNQLYLFNVLDNNMLSFLIDVTSDKMKTPLANLNLLSFNFVRQPLQTLKLLKQDQLLDYYNRIREQIFDFFEKILGVRYNTLEELDKAIQNKTENEIVEAVRKIQNDQNNPDTSFTAQPEVLFSTVNKKLPNGESVKILKLNRSLCYEMFKCDNQALLNEYDAMVLKHYKQTLIDLGVKLNLTSTYVDELDYDLKLSLVSMFFDDTGDDINKTCDKIKEILRTDSTFNNPDLEYFLSKFITLQNITRESAIQIFNKHYWVHGKSAGNVSLSELATVSSEGHKQALQDLVSNEMRKRIEKSTKRNNSQSATFAPMDQGIKHGVPATIRVASIDSLNKKVWNNFGNTGGLHTHDGAIWSAHILRIWERNSQTQMYMANSAKIIALQPDGAGFYQIKCADYSMTNEWIRNSISQADSNSDQFVDGRHLYKLMLSPAKTEQLLKNLLYDDVALLNLGLGLGRSNFNVFYNFQGRLAKLEDIEVSTDLNGNITLIPTWLYTDGEEVPNNIVAETFSLVQDTYSDGLYVKDLYDLWNFFGAELSQSINELGTIDYSDISQEYVAYLVSEYSPELKSQMISKICDPESVKSTPFPINSRNDVYKEGKDLVSVNIHTRYYGPQLDYSHETDEDTIPFTTLVIGAIAFNGENSELVQDLYETIGQITAEALAEITELSDLSNKTKLYKKIGKLVANNLSANGVISNAASILLDSLRTLIDNDEVFAKKALPLSDNQLYHAATAQILSKLNKMIKLRFAGTAVILNPALGIIGVYLDADGITYNKSTIIKKALEWYNSNSLSGLTRTQDIVDAYLNREADDNTFRNRSVFGRYTDSEGNELVLNDLHLLNIADNVLVYASKESLALYTELYNALKETDNPYIYNLEIQDPIVLYQLVNAVDSNLVSGVLKVYNKPRNLATTQITFLDVNGKNTNFWLLLSTQAVIADKSEGISEAKWWLHENRKGIGDKEKPYYYATLEDFKNKIPTYIVKDSIVYKGGEEVLPKQYKRKYSVNGSLSDILELNLNYFRDLAQYRMKADPKINLDEFGKRSFVISTNDYDIIFAGPGTQVGENVTLEEAEQYYRLYTEDDELIPNIKLPIDHNYSVQYVTGEKPQLIIVPSEDITTNTRFAETFLNAVHANSARFNSESTTYAEAFAVLDESLISQDKIEELANLLLTSFKLTLKTVSVRIPSQSFQSFLSNETVLFTESDDNNGYMNLWEMWFQGSDFDIDKAYTIMFEPGENGVIEGNIFSDYSSPDKLLESFLIRQPDTRLKLTSIDIIGVENSGTKAKDVTDLLLKYLKENQTYNWVGLNKLLDSLKLNISDGSILLYNSMYDGSAIDNKGQQISVERYNDLITKLNRYNFTDQNEIYKKNKAMAGIRYASLDIHNLKASQVPMESGPVNNSITESLKRNGSEDSNLIYLNDDPGHIAHFQYQNAIGKEGVGISANAIKVLSAVLQNINNKIKSGILKPITDINTGEVGLNLEFKLNRYDGVRTLNEKVLKIPNTPMTKEQFETFYSPYQTTLPIYKFFEKLQKKDFELLSRIHTGSLNNKERDFLKCYLLLSSETYKPTFLETLYLAEQFELNTADMMSIFISLCTDNAKELSLFKIGATPDLLNLPLAMLALGMDIQDVTDICVQYIVPLMDELNVNRYETEKESDIKEIIQDHVEKADANLKATYESLLKIYNVAQEMKIIARQFKVNQGVSVITTEVQDFLNSLNKQMADNAIDKNQVKTYDDFFGIDGQQAIDTAISNYKATAINIVDIITGSANFFKQLEACYRILGVIEDNIAVPNLTATITKRILGDGIRIKASLSKVVQLTVQNALLTEALKSLPAITFEKRDTEKFGEWNSELANNALIGVSTKMKVDNLLLFIENAFIPYLQLNHKDNFFVQLLRRNTSNGRYELPFNSFDSRGDLRTKMDITKATLAFSQLSPIVTGIHTLDGIDITFGDLMYLYATIVNQNRINSLSTIVKEAAAKTSRVNIAEKIDNYYAELDRLTSISTTDANPSWNFDNLEEYRKAVETLDELAQKIYPYAKASVQGTTVDIITNGVKLSYSKDDNFPLFTMIPGELKIDVGGTYTDMPEWKNLAKNTLLTLLNGHNSSAKINEDSINLNGETLTFTVTLPTQMGKLQRKSLVTVNGIKNGIISVSDYNRAALEISKTVATLSESLTNIAENGRLVKGEALRELIIPYVSDDTLTKALKIIGYDQTSRTIPTFALNLYNWFISKKDSNNNPLLILVVSGSKYIKSHLDKLGTEPILMINPSDFSGKPQDIAYTLMNLFLDRNIESSVIPTPQRRLVQLLISITGNNDINEENLAKYLNSKEILNKIKENSATKNWYQGYLDDTTLPQLKETAWNNLGKFIKALSIADTNGKSLYYYTCDESLDNEVGDIFEDESGIRYIYLGDTDTNFMILRNLDPKSEESVRLTYKSAEEIHSYKRISKPRINSDYSNNKLEPTSQEKELYKLVDTQDIRLGDLVTVNGTEYYISAVLYEKLPNREYNTIILGSSDGKTLEDITSDSYNNVKRIVSDIESTEDSNFTIDKLPDGKLSIKETLVNKMSYGNIFKYYGGNGEIITSRFKSYNRGFITTIDQKLIPVESLHSINNFDLILIYPKLHIDTIGLSLKVPNKESIAGIIYGRPEFKYGYLWYPKGNGSGIIVPRYVYNVNSDKPQFFKPFNIGGDLQYRGTVAKNSKLEKNDTVLILTLSDDQQIMAVTKYLILDAIDDSYVVLESKLVHPSEAEYKNGLIEGLDRSSVNHKVITISRNSLNGGKLYKDETRKGNIRLVENNQILSNTYDLVYELIDYLSKRFGTPVQFVENMEDSSVFARVNNGVIEINMANKPENLSPVYYMMHQGIHEFMHLALTTLKVESPAVYLQLMQEVKSLPEVASNEKYNTSIQQGEEALVRYLTDNIMNNAEGSEVSIKKSDIETKLLLAIKDLLKIDSLTSDDLKKTLRSQIENSELFKDNTFISQEEMLGKALRDEYMLNIKYECD